MTQTPIPRNPATIFLSHGGGPLPVLGDPGHREMVAQLERIAASIEQPQAIVVVSAHWEEEVVTITSSPRPPLLYDYHGFPEESYSLQYPAPGNPDLATRIQGALQASGIDARLNPNRGFDHGLFIPLLLMYPDAEIPCIQVSLLQSLDPNRHIEIGAALSGLAEDRILILGSGFSFHNLRALLGDRDGASDPHNVAFESWLAKTCTSRDIDEATRAQHLLAWDAAPGARHCHPREEHLLPLHVCYGAARRPATWHDPVTILGKRSSTFFW